MGNYWTILLALPLSLTVACGDDDDTTADDDAPTVDAAAGTPDAPANQPDADPNQPDAAPSAACVGPDLDVQDDGTTQGQPPVIISEVNPGDYVELFNTTGQDVDVSMLSAHQWCSFPSYRPVRNDSVIVPAGGYATIPFPTSGQDDQDGELVLYANSSYSSEVAILDYVCWGNGDTIRRDTANGDPVGSNKWNDGCVASIPPGGSLHRTPGNDGTEIAHYEVNGNNTPENCAPSF